MGKAPDLDAVELLSVRATKGGTCLRLNVRGQDGAVQSVSLPANWLNELVSAVPQSFRDGEVHPLASWTMEPAADGEILLTLRTPEGRAVSFTLKSWQTQAIATLAAYGRFECKPRRNMH